MPTKKRSPSTTPIHVQALAGRTIETYALKALIRHTGAALTRKGGSTNWLLLADKAQMRQIQADIEHSGQASWQWLAELVGETYQQYHEQALLNLVKRNPGLSVKQLMALADCTLLDARKAIDAGFE